MDILLRGCVVEALRGVTIFIEFKHFPVEGFRVFDASQSDLQGVHERGAEVIKLAWVESGYHDERKMWKKARILFAE